MQPTEDSSLIVMLVDFRPDQNGGLWSEHLYPVDGTLLTAAERFLAGGCSLITSLVERDAFFNYCDFNEGSLLKLILLSSDIYFKVQETYGKRESQTACCDVNDEKLN
jgi:hypothetical protein